MDFCIEVKPKHQPNSGKYMKNLNRSIWVAILIVSLLLLVKPNGRFVLEHCIISLLSSSIDKPLLIYDICDSMLLMSVVRLGNLFYFCMVEHSTYIFRKVFSHILKWKCGSFQNRRIDGQHSFLVYSTGLGILYVLMPHIPSVGHWSVYFCSGLTTTFTWISGIGLTLFFYQTKHSMRHGVYQTFIYYGIPKYIQWIWNHCKPPSSWRIWQVWFLC